MKKCFFKPIQAICALALIFTLASFPSKADGEWTLKSEVNGVKAYYKIAECDGKQVVFLKFINSNDYEVKIAWQPQIKHKNGVVTNYPHSFHPFVFAKTGEIAESSCMGGPNLQLVTRIHSGPASEIGEFIFLNLEVSKKN